MIEYDDTLAALDGQGSPTTACRAAHRGGHPGPLTRPDCPGISAPLAGFGRLAKAALLGGTALLLAPAVWAQDDGQVADTGSDSDLVLDEILVTAQKRVQSLQSVPQSVSALSGDDLRARNLLETTDLNGAVPNLQVTSAYSRTQPNFSLRGISVANEFSASIASPVGVYVDEVYQNFRASHGQQLYDLDRIEVVRGPQGTLYGRNTTGGAINFITRRPSLEGTEGYVTANYGNFDTLRMDGAAEATIIPGKLGVRFAATFGDGDGYTFNPVDGQYYGDTNYYGARATILWKPNEDMDVLLKVYTAENDQLQDLPYGIGYNENGTDNFGYSRELRGLAENEVEADTAGNYFNDADGIVLTVNYEWDEITLTSITGYDSGTFDLSPFDCDGSPNNVCAIRYNSEHDGFNQDLRLTYTGDRLQVIGGLYYGWDRNITNNEPDFFGILTDLGVPADFFNAPIASADALAVVPAGAGPDPCAPVVVNPNGFFDARSFLDPSCAAVAPPISPILAEQQFTIERPSYAIYGEAIYDVTDKFTVTLGLRYTYDEVRFEDARTVLFDAAGNPRASTVPFSFPFDPSLPAVNLEEDTGRLTGRLILNYQWQDEVMTYASYSRGYRAGAWNGLAYQAIEQVFFVPPEEVDAFEVGLKSRWFDNRLQFNAAAFYYDYQNQQIAEIVGATSFLRAVNGRIWGLEAEFTALVNDWLTIDGSGGYLNSRYDSGQVLDGGGAIGGNEFPNAPDIMANLGATITFWEQEDRSIVLRADGQYIGEYWFDPFNDYGGQFVGSPTLEGQPLASSELGEGNPAYFLANARLTFNQENFAVSLWARNIFDNFYFTYGLNLNAFNQDYLVRGLPRTYGVELTARF